MRRGLKKRELLSLGGLKGGRKPDGTEGRDRANATRHARGRFQIAVHDSLITQKSGFAAVRGHGSL